MHAFRFHSLIFFLSFVLPGLLFSQSYNQYHLPTDAAVTGIAFSTEDNGIITVNDTLIYQVQNGASDLVTFNEHSAVGIQYDFPDYHPANDFVYMPVWASETTIVLIRGASGAAAHQDILATQDAGENWRLLTPVFHPDFLKTLIAVPDEMLYCVYLPDTPGEVYINQRDPGSLLSQSSNIYDIPSESHPPFTGILTPLMTGQILLATQTDSLAVIDLSQHTLNVFVPEIAIETEKGNFDSLYSNYQGVLLGKNNSTLYRSTDGGYTWETVIPNNSFRDIDWTWNTNVYASFQDSLWKSSDAGSTWTNTGFRLPADAHSWDVAGDTWLWIGGDSGRVYRDNLVHPNHIVSPGKMLPQTISLQSYPNPFNSTTVLKYQLPQPGRIEITIVNMLGQIVWSAHQPMESAGQHTIRWSGTDLRGQAVASGMYLVSLNVDGKLFTSRKILLLK